MKTNDAASFPAATMTRTKLDTSPDRESSEADHPILETAMNNLRKQLSRAIEDKHSGIVSVSVVLSNGKPLRVRDSVSSD